MKKLYNYLKTLEGQKLILFICIVIGLYKICAIEHEIIRYVCSLFLLILVGAYGMLSHLVGLKRGANIMTNEVIRMLDAKIERVKKHIEETKAKNN